MATPGSVSEMSARTRANAPTVPVASAASRSIRRGLIREETWLLEAKASGGAAIQPSSMPIATTASAPPVTSSRQRTT